MEEVPMVNGRGFDAVGEYALAACKIDYLKRKK
jgi:hypothetical protein